MTLPNQLHLYDGNPPHVDTDTSRQASQDIKDATASLRDRVFREIKDAHVVGATDDELEKVLDMRHQTCSARRRELVLLGYIVDSGRRRRTRSGRSAIVWIVRPDARHSDE